MVCMIRTEVCPKRKIVCSGVRSPGFQPARCQANPHQRMWPCEPDHCGARWGERTRQPFPRLTLRFENWDLLGPWTLVISLVLGHLTLVIHFFSLVIDQPPID